jgi:hypothetical protein
MEKEAYENRKEPSRKDYFCKRGREVYDMV